MGLLPTRVKLFKKDSAGRRHQVFPETDLNSITNFNEYRSQTADTLQNLQKQIWELQKKVNR